MSQYGKLAFLLVIAVVLTACAGANFSSETDSNVSKDSTNTTVETIRKMKPTLAVRGMACLMCHAQIHSNIVTDFGYGESWYMGGSAPFNGDGNYENAWYTNLANSWATAKKIEGTVFVPDVEAADNAKAIVKMSGQKLKLADFMVMPYSPTWDHDGNMSRREMVVKVTPAAGEERVVATKGQIIITAPSESDIKALAPEMFATGASQMFKRANGSAAVQMKVVAGTGGSYVMNDESQDLDCANADIVVKGTLFLRNLRVKADRGCRLYVSGSVFLEGAVTYVGAGASPNLQITSARGIFLGLDQANLYNRLVKDVRHLKITGQDYPTLAQNILDEGKVVSVMKDEDKQTINYDGILLNAHVVHGRQLGLFRGTIVAQAALFALGEFHFEFDPVFTNPGVNVLPLLKIAILSGL